MHETWSLHPLQTTQNADAPYNRFIYQHSGTLKFPALKIQVAARRKCAFIKLSLEPVVTFLEMFKVIRFRIY